MTINNGKPLRETRNYASDILNHHRVTLSNKKVTYAVITIM